MNDLTLFTDHREALKAFEELWRDSHEWILAFSGFSGLGKSMLLEYLERKHCPDLQIRCLRLSLGQTGEDLIDLFTRLLVPLRSGLPRQAWKDYLKHQDEARHRLEQITAQLSQQVRGSTSVNLSIQANLYEAMEQAKYQAEREVARHWLETVEQCRQPGKLVFLWDDYELLQSRVSESRLGLLWSTIDEARSSLPGLRLVLGSREDLLFVNRVQALRDGLAHSAEFELESFSAADSLALLTSTARRK